MDVLSLHRDLSFSRKKRFAAAIRHLHAKHTHAYLLFKLLLTVEIHPTLIEYVTVLYRLLISYLPGI